MQLQLTAEQQMMQKMVRNFAREFVKPDVARMEEEDRYPKELIQQMGTLGLMGVPIPERYGGSGMDFTSYIIAIHELSKVSAALGVILSVHTSVGTNPILHFGTEAQRNYYLPKLASGDYLGAFALTEASAGSDVANLKLQATEMGDDYILTGSKAFITNGGVADTYITFARTNKEPGSKGLSAFIIEKDTPGLDIGKQEKKMGLHGSRTVELIFDQCRVSKVQMLGKEGEGFKIAMANLNVGRIGIAAQALGIAETALEHATAYAKERKQFDRPIAHNQGISFKLADMATDVEAARLFTYHAADCIERNVSSAQATSMAKLFASRAARNTAIEALQVYGGYGYTEDYPMERFFRDAKVTEIYEGTSEIQHIVISKNLLK